MFRFLVFALLAVPQAADDRLPEFEVISVKPIDLRARNVIDIKVVAAAAGAPTGL